MAGVRRDAMRTGRHTVCVLGGTGFIGTEVVARLSAARHDVIVLTRNPTRHRDLLVLPYVRLVPADVHDETQLRRAFEGVDIVINLVGILNERELGRGRGRQFERVHSELTRKCVSACRATGVRRYLHMSALKADAERGPSHYLRTKGLAEACIRSMCRDGRPEFVILRPSVVFGPRDAFINKFATLLRFMPILPLACADARFAPVYVGDVADAFIACLDRHDVAGGTFELGGPHVMNLADIVRDTARMLRLRRIVLPLSRGWSRLQAALMDFVPGKPFSTDNYLSATVDSICDSDGLAALGILPTPTRGVLPHYFEEPAFHSP
jgi:NADH dehydrogenase